MPRVSHRFGLLGALFGRRWWWSSLVVLAAMLFLARLGLWQLDRLDERRAENVVLEAQFYGERLNLNGAVSLDDPAALVDRRAVVDGRFDYSGQLILKEQRFGGRPGVRLVTPFLINGKDEAILVDRGWIPAEEVAQGMLERFDEAVEGQIEGVLRPSQTLSGDRRTVAETGQVEWYRIDIEAIESQSDYALFPVYLVQTPLEEHSTTLPIREEIEPDLSDGPHIAYAIQWFLFALVLGIGYVRYVQVHDKLLLRKG